MNRLADFWPLALAGAIVAAIGIPTLLFPFGPDQSIFAYIAHRMLQGHFPYVDAWDQKPPAIYFVYALALKFPGSLMRRVRIFDLLNVMLTMAALYLLAQRLWSTWAGFFGALMYGSAYVTIYGYWHMAQPDGYTALPVALALWLYYRFLPGARSWPYALAGLLMGFAFQLRFFTVLLGLGLLLVEWHAAGGSFRRAWRGALRRLLWLSTGFVVMQALFAAYLLAGHALGAYFYTEFHFTTAYARLGGAYSPNGFRWDLYLDAARTNTIGFLVDHAFITAPAVAALVLAFAAKGNERAREFGLFMLLAYLGVLIQAKFFWYHWLAVLPFLALLGGYGLSLAARRLITGSRRAPGALALAGIVLILLVFSPELTNHAQEQWQGVFQYYGPPAQRQAYLNQFGPYADGTFSYLADVEAADYLQHRTQPQDTIYVFGYEPLIYLLSGRESASRFIYAFPVMSTWTPLSWQNEFIGELTDKRPRYILIQANEGAPWITGQHEDTAHYAAHFAALQQLLAARYAQEMQIEDFTIYRLND